MPELLLKPDLGKKGYRLRCLFTTGPNPSKDYWDKARVTAAERFIQDMKRQGWEFVSRYGFQVTGPKAYIEVGEAPPAPKRFSAKEMLHQAMRGEPIRDTYRSPIQSVPALTLADVWEWELAGVFQRDTLLMEYPSPTEEKEMLRKR